MDEKIIKIVSAKLRKCEGQPMTPERLAEIRAAVYSATKTNKFASFSNIKKWVKAARSAMKKDESASKKKGGAGAKPSAKPVSKPAPREHRYEEEPVRHVAREMPVVHDVPKRLEASLNMVKEESMPVQLSEVAMAKPTVVFDKVYLQGIKFEIAGIRQTMERVSRQLDKLEKAIVAEKED